MTLFKTQNKTWDEEFNSTKLLIYANNLVKFKVTYHRFTGKTPNPNEKVQRVKSTSMEEHFNTLKSSEFTFSCRSKMVGSQLNLTRSLNHQFEKPATVEMFPDSRSRILVSPMKICCFQSIDVMIIIFKFIRTVYLHLKLYEILNFIVLVIDQ